MQKHVKNVEGQIRQSINRYNTEKMEDIKQIKVLEKHSMCQLTSKVQRQLEELNNKEKELIDIGS